MASCAQPPTTTPTDQWHTGPVKNSIPSGPRSLRSKQRNQAHQNIHPEENKCIVDYEFKYTFFKIQSNKIKQGNHSTQKHMGKIK